MISGILIIPRHIEAQGTYWKIGIKKADIVRAIFLIFSFKFILLDKYLDLKNHNYRHL